MFVVLEGIDGCGKSTVANKLALWLKSQDKHVVLTAEPTKGRIGQFTRDVLGGKEKVDPRTLALLFTADRMEHASRIITPSLTQNKIVLCERYYYSTVAYQAAQGVDWEWLRELNRRAPKPDVAFLLDAEPERSVARTTTGEIFEKAEFLKLVRENYLKFDDLELIEEASIEEMLEKIKEKLTPLL